MRKRQAGLLACVDGHRLVDELLQVAEHRVVVSPQSVEVRVGLCNPLMLGAERKFPYVGAVVVLSAFHIMEAPAATIALIVLTLPMLQELTIRRQTFLECRHLKRRRRRGTVIIHLGVATPIACKRRQDQKR